VKTRAEDRAPAPAPEGLSSRAATLWAELVPRVVKGPGRLALLEEALRARDRADECRALIAAQGLVTITKRTGAFHVHPLVKAEKDARAVFAKLAGLLRLAWDFRGED
jgi:phage terminase small subunit